MKICSSALSNASDENHFQLNILCFIRRIEVLITNKAIITNEVDGLMR